MKNKRFALISLIVFLFVFLTGGVLLLRPVDAEPVYRYVHTGSDTFTPSDIVVLEHNGGYAIGVDGNKIATYTITVESGEIVSGVSSSVLWLVEEGETKGSVRFKSLACEKYLRWSSDVILDTTGTDFVNSVKLQLKDGAYLRYVIRTDAYSWTTRESLGMECAIYKQVEEKPSALNVFFYDGEELFVTKEIPAGGDKFTIDSLGVSAPVKDGYAFVGWELNGEMVEESKEIEISENLSLYARYTVGEKYRVSLSLKGDIAIHIYMRFDEETANRDGYMRISACKKEERVPFSSAEKVELEGIIYHKFTCRVSAKDYDALVQMQVLVDGVEGTAFSYSVKEYAEKLLALENGEFDEVKPLVRALLVYCERAKGYCYDGVTESVEGVGLSHLESYKTVVSGTLDGGVAFLGGTLTLETTTKLRIYFTAQQAPACTVDGVETAAQTDEQGRYYLEIPDISAKDLDETHLFTIGGYSVTASALSYAYAVLSGNYDEHLQNLVKALYLYSMAANEYFQGVN